MIYTDNAPAGHETGRLIRWVGTHGFLQPEYGRGNVLLHSREIRGPAPEIGDRFDYIPVRAEGGHYATHVTPRARHACD